MPVMSRAVTHGNWKNTMNTAHDLAKEQARSPRIRIGGCALLLRMSRAGSPRGSPTVREDAQLLEPVAVNDAFLMRVLDGVTKDKQIESILRGHLVLVAELGHWNPAHQFHHE